MFLSALTEMTTLKCKIDREPVFLYPALSFFIFLLL